MRGFSNTALTDMNKLHSSVPWLIFVDIKTPTEQYFVRNNEDVTFGTTDSKTYLKSSFDLEAIPSKSTGELPQVSLSVFASKDLVDDVEERDGYIGTDVVIYIVHYASVTSVAREDWPLQFKFSVKGCSITDHAITFELGVQSYLKKQFPLRLYRRDSCDFKFQGDYCWMKGKNIYSGESSDCDHTLEACTAHFNKQKENGVNLSCIPYGGFPTIGKGSYVYR